MLDIINKDFDGKESDRSVFRSKSDNDFYDNVIAREFDDMISKKIIAVIKNSSEEMQKNLFTGVVMEMLKKKKLSDDDKGQLNTTSQVLAYGITEFDAIKKELELFEQKIYTEFVDEDQLPNHLFTGVENIDGKIVAKSFHDIIEIISKAKNKKDAQKAIAELQQKTGDVPVIAYLELQYLRFFDIKKFPEKLKEYYQKYPNYFLIQIYYALTILAGEDKGKEMETLQNSILKKEHPLTKFEADDYFYVYTYFLNIDKTVTLATILAFEKYLEKTIGIVSDKILCDIVTLVRATKLEKLAKHFGVNIEKS